MRIIAGKARRMKLVAPGGQKTRPTADRAKEGLFNILAPKIHGARFLDMFCGSGAIGIEALSRGAETAVFVDNSPVAVRAVRENLAKTRLSEANSGAEIFEMSAERAIARLVAQGRKFDIIFLDPPYNSDLFQQTLAKIPKILAENGIIIAETETAPAELSPTTTRTYGRTNFMFFEGEV